MAAVAYERVPEGSLDRFVMSQWRTWPKVVSLFVMRSGSTIIKTRLSRVEVGWWVCDVS